MEPCRKKIRGIWDLIEIFCIVYVDSKYNFADFGLKSMEGINCLVGKF